MNSGLIHSDRILVTSFEFAFGNPYISLQALRNIKQIKKIKNIYFYAGPYPAGCESLATSVNSSTQKLIVPPGT